MELPECYGRCTPHSHQTFGVRGPLCGQSRVSWCCIQNRTCVLITPHDLPESILSIVNVTVSLVGNTSKFSDRCGPWVGAMVGAEGSTPLSSISGYLRLEMAESDPSEPRVGYVDSDSTSFGPESEDRVIRKMEDTERTVTPSAPASPNLREPWVLVRVEAGLIGCYKGAATFYTLLGVVAMFICLVRIWASPPRLTSWSGQHVYLAMQGGMVSNAESFEVLSKGDEAANKQLGRLNLKKIHLAVAGRNYANARRIWRLEREFIVRL